MLPIILASSSPYRRELLQKLAIPFSWQASNVDESPLPHEHPADLVQRLALSKARAVQPTKPAWIIGADQVAFCQNQLLTKPHNFARAYTQLSLMSQNKVRFFTGLCLLNSQDHTYQLQMELATLYFRQLSDVTIKSYLTLEQPFDCAGSFKFEAHGISLLQRIQTRDPHTIIGLPLITLTDMFNKAGVLLEDYWQSSHFATN